MRSTAISKANRLQKCHRHIEELAPAFAEWAEGKVYVCKKTGTYRERQCICFRETLNKSGSPVK